MMMELAPKQVQEMMLWAGLEVPRAPTRQMSKREKEKLGQAYTPKLKKPARERLAMREAEQRRQQAFEQRNAPENESNKARRGAGRSNLGRTSSGRTDASKMPYSESAKYARPTSKSAPPGEPAKKPLSKRSPAKKTAVKRRRAF
jgi:23S rRNA pseudouridine2605 synthase